MARTINLTRLPQRNPAGGAYSQTLTASGGVSMADEIFVMRQRPLDPTSGSLVAAFDHVATPADMANLPINAPLPGAATYRVSSFLQVLDNQSLADLAWANVQSSVNDLIRALNAQDVGGTAVTVVCTG